MRSKRTLSCFEDEMGTSIVAPQVIYTGQYGHHALASLPTRCFTAITNELKKSRQQRQGVCLVVWMCSKVWEVCLKSHERSRTYVRHHQSGCDPMERLTLTLTLLNVGRWIMLGLMQSFATAASGRHTSTYLRSLVCTHLDSHNTRTPRYTTLRTVTNTGTILLDLTQCVQRWTLSSLKETNHVQYIMVLDGVSPLNGMDYGFRDQVTC